MSPALLEIGVPDDYEPSPGEVNNLVYLCCKYTVGWPMRTADLAVCTTLAGEVRGRVGLTKLARVTCEYVWDHICGEPEEPNAEQLFEHMRPILVEWYRNSTPASRALID